MILAMIASSSSVIVVGVVWIWQTGWETGDSAINKMFRILGFPA